MLINLTVNWEHLMSQLFTLWLIGWGLRAILIGLLLGGLFWWLKRSH